MCSLSPRINPPNQNMTDDNGEFRGATKANIQTLFSVLHVLRESIDDLRRQVSSLATWRGRVVGFWIACTILIPALMTLGMNYIGPQSQRAEEIREIRQEVRELRTQLRDISGQIKILERRG